MTSLTRALVRISGGCHGNQSPLNQSDVRHSVHRKGLDIPYSNPNLRWYSFTSSRFYLCGQCVTYRHNSTICDSSAKIFIYDSKSKCFPVWKKKAQRAWHNNYIHSLLNNTSSLSSLNSMLWLINVLLLKKETAHSQIGRKSKWITLAACIYTFVST